MCEQAKTIILFHITGMNSEFTPQTNRLISKMQVYAKQQNIDVVIRMDSASKIDSKGKDFDI